MSISASKKNIIHYVEEICSRSPRYAGTEGEARTLEYIVSEGRKLGVSVELEEFEYVHYWPKSSKLETLVPFESALDNLPLCYAGSDIAEGDVLYAGSGTLEEFELLSKQGVDISDKIVLARSAYTHFTYPLAQQYGAGGLVFLTDVPGNLCRVGTATLNREAGKIPAVLVPASVGQKLLTLMGTGQLKLRVALSGEFSTKTSSNIILTIPGTIISDEQVVITAHYDSHNLGKHAYDNASGCASVLELARIFSQLKPARTIKAIIFGVEELGLWGSSSYVDKHAGEIPHIRAVLTCDGMGSPYDFKFELRATTKEIHAFALDIVQQLGHNVVDVKFDANAEPGPRSDNLPFQLKGVPTAWPHGEDKSIFFHTAKDDPETLDYDKLKSLLDIDKEIAYRIATQRQLPF